MAQWVRSMDLTARISLSPIRRGFAPSFVNYKKGCNRLAAASDRVYLLLAQGRWFSPGIPTSSTTKDRSPWYSWNTTESGVKHNKSTNENISILIYVFCSRLLNLVWPFQPWKCRYRLRSHDAFMERTSSCTLKAK